MLKGSVLIFIVLLIPVLCAAQQDSTFTSRANVVSVPTLVLDRELKTVEGLRASDFVIEDDGIAQKLLLDDDPDVQPISLMIAVQCRRRAAREYGRISTLASMLDPALAGPDTEAALLLFDSKLNLAQDFSNRAERTESLLKNLPSGDGGAAILDAIAYSARLLARRPTERQKVLLLISETRDHGSKLTKFDDLVPLIGGNNISVYTLPFSPYKSQQLDVVRGSNRDEWPPNIDILEKLEDIHQAMRKNTPRALTSITGGEYESFVTQNGFESDMVEFTNHLYSRYRLSFAPKDPKPGLHQIRVRLREPKAGEKLLFRTTYWVTEGDSSRSQRQ
jgi:VWFA-related protein